MSFSGTPLGQARRLDRDTFLGKPHSNGNRPPSPHRIIPSSYTLGAPVLGPRSPSKPPSPTRDPLPNDSTENEPALARFARQKQREAAAASRPGAPRTTITSPLNPTKWAVKDTTVNIAAAFIQAANSGLEMAPPFNPSNSWASSSRTATHIPRSTSVEYEAQASATQGRRLPVPNRFPARGTGSAGQKPPSKTRSLQHVPDSEGEEQGPGGRAKSPLEQIVQAARQALDPAVFYVRQRLEDSTENQSVSVEQPSINGNHVGNDSSYNYEAEERFVQREQERGQSNTTDRGKPRRGRISVDNQAWKPSRSDGEESDDDEPEKRRKGKKLPVARLTNLPTVVDGRATKRRRPRGSKGNVGGAEDDDAGGGSDDNSYTEISASIIATQRASMPPPPRISVDPPEQTGEVSMDFAEQGLQSIPEVPEEDLQLSAKATSQQKPRSRSRRGSRATTPSPSQRFSIGALLGNLIRYVVTTASNLFIVLIKVLASCLFLLGRVCGTTYDVIVNRPYQWVSGTRPGLFLSLAKYVLLGATILSAWYALQNPAISSHLPSLPISHPHSTPVYTAPGAPVGNIDELIKRLAKIEAALSDLSTDSAKIKMKTEDSSKNYGDVLQRLGSVEGRISAEARRISDTESKARETIGKSVNTVKQEVENLQAQLEAQQRQQQAQQEKDEKEKEKNRPVADVANDEEARARLRVLEERVGSVEGGVKDALELSKKMASTPLPVQAVHAPNQGAAWWNKIISKSGTKEGLKITTPDGQDVTRLISHLVDNAISVVSKDGLAKPDFALYSAGGRVIPSLTSPTFEIKPSTMSATIFSALTGNGYAIGHPPVTAIEPSLHAGRCWPIVGSSGQLGVSLAAPAYVEEITIDHVAKEVAFDMRTAPRQMEVWGLVEGKENIAKLREHRERKVAALREALETSGEVLEADWEEKELERQKTQGYPTSLPLNPEYVRIARFTYDIYASKHVQTFAVDGEVKDLGMDFGVLVARILNNWGHDSYTCLYRFRVHGQRMGELPAPYSEVEEGATEGPEPAV